VRIGALDTEMTLEDLRTSLNTFMPVWCDIEISDDGEVVIFTRLRQDEAGELVPVDAD
jgi:hypothetical protein